MKILTVNNTADMYGASRCMEMLFKKFVEDGHEVHAVLPEEGPLCWSLRSRGLIVHVHRGLPILDRAQMKTIRGILGFFWKLPLSVLYLMSLVLKEEIEVVHTNVAVLPSPALAALLTGRRHIWHFREMLGEFGVLWQGYQHVVSILSNPVIAVSQCTREQFEPSLRHNVVVVYDGLDETSSIVREDDRKLVRAGLPHAALVVGVAGRIKFRRKGQEVLVEAAKMLRDQFPDVYYVIIGSASPGNEEHVDRLRMLIAAHDMADRISLLGELTHPPSIFAALDIAVVPSVLPEPFGLVVIEAMAVGTPVVGSRIGGIAEQIVDGQSGFLFTPGDAKELAGALSKLLSAPALRDLFGQEGRERVKACFSVNETYRLMNCILLRDS